MYWFCFCLMLFTNLSTVVSDLDNFSPSKGIEDSEVSVDVAVQLGGYVAGRGKLTERTKIIIKDTSIVYAPADRRYYYGFRNYKGNSELVCGYLIAKNDEHFDLWFSDTERVREIIYDGCKGRNPSCCYGLDCCQTLFLWWQMMMLVGGGFIAISLTAFMFWKCCCDYTEDKSSGKISNHKLDEEVKSPPRSTSKDTERDHRPKAVPREVSPVVSPKTSITIGVNEKT